MATETDKMKLEVEPVKLGTFIVTCACATLGMMVSLCFLVFHIYHRKNKIVKMSSPYMNIVTSTGAIFLSVVCFLYGLDYIMDDRLLQLTYLCQARIWVVVLSITLVYGPVAMKTWRVHKIFKYGFAKKVIIHDSRLLFFVTGMLMVDVTLMTLWQTIDPVHTQNVLYTYQAINGNNVTSGKTEFSLVRTCQCEKIHVWIGVLVLWKVTLAILCLYLAWKIRSVSVPCLNDAAHTIAAIFTSILLTFCVSMVTLALHGDPNTVYILTSVVLSSTAIIVQMILFFPKVRYWWRTPDNTSPRISTLSLKEHMRTVPEQLCCDVNENLDPDDGLLNIVEENKQLKDSLLEKEKLINSLQCHLDNAKDQLSRFPADMDFRQDSGLEDEEDTRSKEGLYDVLRPPDRPQDRSGAYRVEGSQADTQETRDSEHVQHETKLKRIGSYYSLSSGRHSFVAEFTDIRNSIAAELDSASVDLRNALTEEAGRAYSETEWLYESAESKELAGSIAQSYNLGVNNETYSYIQSYLPKENNVIQIRKTRRLSGSSVMSAMSSENVSNKSVDMDNISCTLGQGPRDSATPNSQQHAAILRYYSYRHMNGRFRSPGRQAREVARVPSYRNVQSNHDNETPQQNNNVIVAKSGDIYSIPVKSGNKPSRVLVRLNPPKDSFV